MPNKFLIVCGGAGVGLLGQHKVLGLSADMQIDVSKEIVPTRDPLSLRIELDRPVGTVQHVQQDLRVKWSDSNIQSAAARHARFFAQQYRVGGALMDGLAQSPAVGGATIRYGENETELRERLSHMVHTIAKNVGQNNPLEVWIISSTAGGTGEGIHRYVGQTLADVVGNAYWAYLKLNFICVGPLTYQSINSDRTRLNTFFGIAADAAFALGSAEDYPGTTTNWFYIEVPDVGAGDSAKPIRGEIVEMACKSIMLDELQGPLNVLLVNDGLRMVLTRTGYWGTDFAEKVKYYETLRQLVEKLHELITPDYYLRYVSGRLDPTFDAGSALPKVIENLQKEDHLLSKMESEKWRFPRHNQRASDDDRMREWRKSINTLISPVTLDDLVHQVRFEIEEPEEIEGERKRGFLTVPEYGEGTSEEWFRAIENAHRVKAWSSALLVTSTRTQYAEGLKDRLNRLAKACSDAQHGFDPRKGLQDRASQLSELLPDFVETLTKVEHLTQLEKAADRLLNTQLATTKKLLEEATRERDRAKAAIDGMGSSPVIAADLSDKLDRLQGEVWLRTLERSLRLEDREHFRREVLRGAIGLTRAGLLSVLNLPGNADVKDIRHTLNSKMGRMVASEGSEFEAQWWQAKTPPGVKKLFAYRILPKLEPDLRAQLGDGEAPINYVYTGLGVIGLYALAFECAALGTEFDTATTPAYLLTPFLPLVRATLNDWPTEPRPGMPHGQIRMCSAGVIGEPLYEEALRRAGLNNGEIGKIAYFYELYNPKA